MRSDKSGIRQQNLPLFAKGDQVVAVGAIAVQEDDQLLCDARLGRDPRPIKGFGHVEGPFIGKVGCGELSFSAQGQGFPAGLGRRCVASEDVMIDSIQSYRDRTVARHQRNLQDRISMSGEIGV